MMIIREIEIRIIGIMIRRIMLIKAASVINP